MYNKFKSNFEIVLKRHAEIKRHFKNNPLFRVQLLSAINNHINILLDECKSSVEPMRIESYFSMCYIF